MTRPTPEFFYFDLGNVLLHFDHRRACRQMAAVAGVETEQVWSAVFESDLQQRYEAGAVSSREFYEVLCRQIDAWPDFDRLEQAGSDIFEPNESALALLADLSAAGRRLGMLSNTCESHYKFFADGRYPGVPAAFEIIVTSFEVGAMKPDAKIFHAAAERAGVAPERIFYVDDIAGHVAAARALGFDAVQYTTTDALIADLRERGVQVG